MGKYDPLTAYLRRQHSPAVEMTFRSIEGKIGYMLPKVASTAAWWRCDGAPGPRDVQKAAWRAAGYGATLMSEDRVLFERLPPATAVDQAPKSKAI